LARIKSRLCASGKQNVVTCSRNGSAFLLVLGYTSTMLGDTLLGDAAAERERRRQNRQTSTSLRTLLTVVWLQLHLQEVVEDAVFIQLSRARRRQSSAHPCLLRGFTLHTLSIDPINVELLSDTASTFV